MLALQKVFHNMDSMEAWHHVVHMYFQDLKIISPAVLRLSVEQNSVLEITQNLGGSTLGRKSRFQIAISGWYTQGYCPKGTVHLTAPYLWETGLDQVFRYAWSSKIAALGMSKSCLPLANLHEHSIRSPCDNCAHLCCSHTFRPTHLHHNYHLNWFTEQVHCCWKSEMQHSDESQVYLHT